MIQVRFISIIFLFSFNNKMEIAIYPIERILLFILIFYRITDYSQE